MSKILLPFVYVYIYHVYEDSSLIVYICFENDTCFIFNMKTCSAIFKGLGHHLKINGLLVISKHHPHSTRARTQSGLSYVIFADTSFIPAVSRITLAAVLMITIKLVLLSHALGVIMVL